MTSGEPGTSQFTEGEEEVPISLNEYIEAETQLEEDARAVLGSSDAQNCSYAKGYVKRQALYTCVTCSTEKGEAGICLACSLNCHDGHDLYELYTKRNFRCDCGNSKFETKCKLLAGKEVVNTDNKYNQNFTGVYCVCHRPYPDPESEDDREMIQCCVCEDWFHDNHLELDSDQAPADYEEMICVTCVRQHAFLLNYGSSFVAEKLSPTDEKVEVSVTKSEHDCKNVKQETSDDAATDTKPKVNSISDDTGTSLHDVNSQSIKQEREAKLCPYLKTHKGSMYTPRTLFMVAEWRTKLCTCSQCVQLYREKDIEFLLDPEDPNHVYEEANVENADGDGTSYEQGMSALSSLDRVQQVELIAGYNDMKENLVEYLRKFGSNKVIRAQDIQEFFTDLKNKRRKLSVPPSSCS